jgi:tRNA(adenine34) deaminase
MQNILSKQSILEKDIFFMQQAIILAKKAQNANEVPVGAVAVINDEVIGEGYNCPIKNHDPTAHAEIITLRQAAKQLNNYRLPNLTLYTTLEPCIMCVGAMLHARIERLVFGASDPKTGAIISVFRILDEKSLNHKISYQHGILSAECGNLLSEFFKIRRNQ